MEEHEGNIKEEPSKEISYECPPADDEVTSSPLAYSTPVTTKRRGRKPKSASTAEKTPNAEQTPELKGYPKRNRKNPARFEHYDKSNEEYTSALSSNDDISQDITKDSDNDTEQEDKPKQRTGHKRGRPSKTLQESIKETPSPKRKRASLRVGEDSKDRNEDKDNSVSVKTGTKGRRGRRKLKNDDDVSDDSEEEKNESGNKSERSKQQTVSNPDTPRSTGRRGRKAKPKKAEKSPSSSSEDEASEGSEWEVTPVKKSRGRGRKPQSAKEDDESETTCLRCQQKFPNLSTLKNHLARRHTALYSPDCPEGKDDRASVRQILKTRKILYCPKCDKELRNAQYYFKHTEWCGRETETFTCTICHKSCKKMYEVEHYRNHKLLERKEKERQEQRQVQATKKKQKEEAETDDSGRRIRKAAKKAVSVLKDISASGDACAEDDSDDDPEVKLDVEEDGDDQEEEEDEDIDEDASDESNRNHSELEDEDDQTGRGKKGQQGAKRTQGPYMYREVYIHCCKKYLKRSQVIDKMPDVFPELRPQKSQWIIQNSKEVEDFLPVTKKSVRFQVLSPGKKEKTPPLKQLNRFEAEYIGGIYNFFAGGPVWGLAWCPVPHNVKCDQFLAISCHRKMAEFHETKSQYLGKGAIQLWNVGEMSSMNPDKSKSGSIPFLEFCISHTYGVIYQLCWCPSNAWESNEDKGSEQLPRLGLLAGAFSDGNVHIYSLPQPASLNLGKQGNKPAVFKPEPVFSLIPHPKFKQEKVAPCLCVDWQQKSCQFLAAGYGDGSVRVWDLKSQTNLLRVATTPTIKLLPFHSTVAHSDSVMSLKWSPHVTDKFATASRDRTFVIWDLNNRHFPIFKTPAQMALSVYWLPFNFCVLQGMDDCYSNLETYVRSESYDNIVEDNGIASDPVVVLSDCVWGLTCSNWLMVILATNNSGNVIGSVMPQLKRKQAKRFHRRPVILFETAVQEKDFDKEHISDQEELSKNENGKKKNADPTVFKSYESGMNKIYLEYKEYDPFQPKRKIPKITVAADDVRSLAFRAIYRIEMSPNIQSCVWVASGGHAGIVRIHNVAHQLIPTAVQDLKDVRNSLNIK